MIFSEKHEFSTSLTGHKPVRLYCFALISYLCALIVINSWPRYNPCSSQKEQLPTMYFTEQEEKQYLAVIRERLGAILMQIDTN
jgi:hypothetical protein